ncbi:hypothetical protein KEJ47_09255 [Candidatus Bathyarchaeota archaeon]|nr:hypothetical protein [Candidatus Bathyarchaeota archaeon]
MKPLSCKKGLSPIFASLLILAIITTLFIPVFLWATGVTSGTSDFWNRQASIETERIVIEVVNLKGGKPSCTVYVRNIGKTVVSIQNVLIIEPSGNVRLYLKVDGDFTLSPEYVSQGDLITVNVDLRPWAPVSGQTYIVKVFTFNGVGDQYQIVA